MKNLKKYWTPKNIIIAILIFTALSRLYNIWYPSGYVFDEVYHAFTAKEYVLNHKEAWEYWTTPPPGVAYEWTHPPLAKEIMALSMIAYHTLAAWAYRLPGVLMGILSVFLVYKLAQFILKNEHIALLSAFLFSIDGLNFVQSRTGMNDIYMVTFMLASLLFFLRKKFFWAAVFLGLSLASKWSAIYLFGLEILLVVVFEHFNPKRLLPHIKTFLILTFVPIAVYLLSYIPFFLLGHSFSQFWSLQQQMWWYHTGLKATHDYASQWWSWPLNLYPIWYYVDYHTNTTISNIFASGNPPLFWMGAGAVLTSIYTFFKEHSQKLLLLILGFLAFWLPWAISPRIMFLYHFSPSVPFMVILLASQIAPLYNQKYTRKIYFALVGLIVVGFLFIYPFLIGAPIPHPYMQIFFKTNITKNPFVNFQ
jgi:dolichyl-phosphate-mannose-protein mannosyltransferase